MRVGLASGSVSVIDPGPVLSGSIALSTGALVLDGSTRTLDQLARLFAWPTAS